MACFLCFYSDVRAIEQRIDGSESTTAVAQDVELTVTVLTNRVPVLTPIFLQAVLDNRTTNSISFRSANQFDDCVVRVTDQEGSVVPQTQYSKWLASPRLGQNGYRIKRILPGSRHVFTIPVNLIYDMSVVEEYTLTAHVSVTIGRQSPSKKIKIESKPLRINVIWIYPLIDEFRKKMERNLDRGQDLKTVKEEPQEQPKGEPGNASL